MTIEKRVTEFRSLPSAVIGGSFAILSALPATAAKEPDAVADDPATMTGGTGGRETRTCFLIPWGMQPGLATHSAGKVRDAGFGSVGRIRKGIQTRQRSGRHG